MYLRQSNKWNKFLLAEAIENIGLPPRVVTFIRSSARFAAIGDQFTKERAEDWGVERQHVGDKQLTWLGLLVKKFPMSLLTKDDIREVADFIKKEVQRTDPEPSEERGERMVDAIGPLIDAAQLLGPVLGTTQTLADTKALLKRTKRAVVRAGLSEDFAKKVGTIFDHRVLQNVKNNESLRVMVNDILSALVLDPPVYEEELKGADSLGTARMIARGILNNPKKDPDKVIHTFDNGYFWYDVQSHACDFEAKEMGHCGRGDQGALISLRSGEKRKMKPFITLEFDGTTLYQIKGKANKAPKSDLWPYIDWFVENMGVERIVEAGRHSDDGLGFAEMLAYLEEKHEDVKFKDAWALEANELLEQYESSIETDMQTFLELDYASADGSGEVDVVLRHQVFWPVKDIIVDEDTARLRWEIRQDAQSIADDTLYPNPEIRQLADVFARGVQDSQTAMLRIELIWSDSFYPSDEDNEEDVKHELERLDNYLAEIGEISGWVVAERATEDAEFDYNAFWEGIEKRLREYGVYRDIAAEIDAETEREDSPQMDLPLQEVRRPEPDWFSQAALLRERRIIQRWQQIIK